MAKSSHPEAGIPNPEFRWQALFQRSADALFLLNRRRRLLFINRACERLIGLANAEVRGLVCTQRTSAIGSSPAETVAQALWPPAEVWEGKTSRSRRCRRGTPRHWWDVEFFPLRAEDGGLLAVVGKIVPVEPDNQAVGMALPEKLVALRAQLAGRYSLETLDSPLPAMRRVAGQVRLARLSQVPLLIAGEPGTGRQWLARIIHHHGALAEQSFAAVDCALMPPAVLETVLFGEAGLVDRPGIGTLYLKEPDRLPRDLQGRLGDWLASSESAIPRLIAGCGPDPAAQVRAGRFLEPVYCAMATLMVELPPLRERRPDLRRLVERMLERLNALEGRPLVGLTSAAWELLEAYAWPGNLRELYQVLAGCRSRCRAERIDAADLPAFLRLAVTLERTPPADPHPALPLDRLLEQVERRLIELALRRTRGNKSQAAEMLKVWRPRLLRRMEALGLGEDKETRKQADKETRRQGDKEGEKEIEGGD